ncbi:hypothetical protein MPH_12809 [Macrophomina phaseolina MS6]|uniref:Uncharacterized protein n=1 Tax=Macrophomina phaseolina (strain MS6) TaxID=1126212 RepID=K2RJB1_MACPH|nr:hypothetical protein MPH_12809 [Macrophomina phaseolina MS6]
MNDASPMDMCWGAERIWPPCDIRCGRGLLWLDKEVLMRIGGLLRAKWGERRVKASWHSNSAFFDAFGHGAHIQSLKMSTPLVRIFATGMVKSEWMVHLRQQGDGLWSWHDYTKANTASPLLSNASGMWQILQSCDHSQSTRNKRIQKEPEPTYRRHLWHRFGARGV